MAPSVYTLGGKGGGVVICFQEQIQLATTLG